MKLPLSWIQEFVSIDDSPEEIADLLTMAGLEVDAVEAMELPFSNVVVAKVMEAKQHPDAEKLRVAQVFDGENTLQVVCGAENCREGLVTAFAKVGAFVVDGDKKRKIKKGKLRGIESQGMLCAPDELGLGTEHYGIMELPETLQPGTPLEEIEGEIVFEISLTPNLNHCSCALGVAREIAAAKNLPLKMPEFELKEEGTDSINDYTSVTIEDFERCPRYSCRYIEGIKVGPSPQWLAKRLEASGVRSINNVVDATNLVLMELGHPLHAFDYDQLRGGKIIVKTASEGEKFTTLDDKERTLRDDVLMICDGEGSTAVAGVMGGQTSEVSDSTVNVLLESAYFNPSNIRRTSKFLDLTSEASKRFERGCDPNGTRLALDRAAAMIVELAGGRVVPGVIDVNSGPFEQKKVAVRLKRVNQILGTQLTLAEMEECLVRLQFELESDHNDVVVVDVPTYRVDITAEIDLIEEVARVYGYSRISREPASYRSSRIGHSPLYVFESDLRNLLVGEGLQEFLNCDLISPELNAMADSTDAEGLESVAVLKPTSVDQSILRRSLLPGNLENIKYNLDHQSHNISAFEIGRRHYKSDGKYNEDSLVSIVMTGQRRPQSWGASPEECDFFDIKGVVENLCIKLGIDSVKYSPGTLACYHTQRQAKITVGALDLGTIGEVHPALQRKFDIDQRVYFAQLNTKVLFELRYIERQLEPLANFPGSERDWTVTLKNAIPIERVVEALRQTPSRLLEGISLLGIYQSEKLGNDKKNVTFRFTYRDKKKTVSQESVEREHDRIISGANKLLKEEILG